MSFLEALNMVLFLVCFFTFGGYVCRLDALHVREHRLAVILLHVALAIVTAWAGIQAWRSEAGPGELAGAAGALLWLINSWATWRNGPPAHTRRFGPDAG